MCPIKKTINRISYSVLEPSLFKPFTGSEFEFFDSQYSETSILYIKTIHCVTDFMFLLIKLLSRCEFCHCCTFRNKNINVDLIYELIYTLQLNDFIILRKINKEGRLFPYTSDL